MSDLEIYMHGRFSFLVPAGNSVRGAMLPRKLEELGDKFIAAFFACTLIPFCAYTFSANGEVQFVIETASATASVCILGLWSVKTPQHIRKINFPIILVVASLAMLCASIVIGESLAPSVLRRMKEPLALGGTLTLGGVLAGLDPVHSFDEKLRLATAYSLTHLLRFFILARHLQPTSQCQSRTMACSLSPGSESRELIVKGSLNFIVFPIMAAFVGVALRSHMNEAARRHAPSHAPSDVAGRAARPDKNGSSERDESSSPESSLSEASKGSQSKVLAGIPSVVESLAVRHKYLKDWDEVKFLGMGSFARVVLLHNPVTNEYAAAKKIPAVKGREHAILSIEREAQALAGLPRHPHVIGFRTCFLSDGNMHFITDYAAGGTLDQVIRRARPNGATETSIGLHVSTVVRWLAQLTSALMMVHSHSILHRDLKPGNIFLSDDSAHADIQLGDFGLSRPLESQDGDTEAEEEGINPAMVHSTVGTPFYMAPEQILGQPYSFPADVWAFGCICFELVTLKRPFDARSFPELALQITDESKATSYQHELLEARRHRKVDPFPENLLTLVSSRRLLQRDPARRTTLLETAECIAPLLDPADTVTRALLPCEPRTP